MTQLKGKVALVTGGSRGIGAAVVRNLAQAGCHVAFSYVHNQKAAEALEQELSSKGFKVKASQVDVTDFDAVKGWVSAVKEEFSRLDILVNNAGIIIDKPLMMMAQDDWKKVLDTNLNGMFNASKACIVTFMKQKHGQIVNISSISGIIGLVGQTNYSASKGGMNAFTKALAKEVAGFGIKVNAIAPGFIETDILSKFKDEDIAKIADTVPMKRIGTPDDVAGCVRFLLSDQAKYITGQIIQVDGGLAMR